MPRVSPSWLANPVATASPSAPCATGWSKPAALAAAGSRWMGFRSPDNSAKARTSASVTTRSAVAKVKPSTKSS